MTIANALRHILPALCAGVLLAAAAQGAPAQARTQAPGYFRYADGAFEVTALYDGYFYIDTKILHGIEPKAIAPLLAASFTGNSKGILTSVNAFLVHTGDHLVLVDAGMAGCPSATLGHMLENFRAAGYRPEDVDTVLITHMHNDHVCGLAADGKSVFPNATVYAAQEEAAFWLDDAKQKSFERVRAALAPYREANKFRTFKGGDAVLPGVTAIATHGHTPGHTSYLFQSGPRSLVVLGDIVHVAALQFARPGVSIDYDTNPKEAVAERRDLFAELARTGWTAAGAHLPFHGIGHVRKDGKAYAYVPVEYAPLPDKP
ncbi:MAG TPA: MBL fold metallo-hydrolase [Rhizomicrobium sp.]